MTDNRTTRPSKRQGRGNGLAWKSGLLASSVGAVLMGWALLGQMEAAPSDIAAATALSEPQVLVVDLPVTASIVSDTQQSVGQQPIEQQPIEQQPVEQQSAEQMDQVSVPAMPQKPVFQVPVTRTRGS